MSVDLCRKAVEEAGKHGASYADVRVVELSDENLSIRKGVPLDVKLSRLKGAGIRVLADGAWGFAGSIHLDEDGVVDAAGKAVKVAHASSKLKRRNVELTPSEPEKTVYKTPFKKDPFKVPLEEKVETLVDAERILAEQSPQIKTSFAFFRAFREDKLFVSSEGAEIKQQITWCGGGMMCVAVRNGDVQRRSYPSSFRGNYGTGGYEVFESLKLVDHAKATGAEAVQLLDAEKCPSGVVDLIITGEQLGLQIHESCGHPTELDRALGMEADYAGTSFLTPDKLGEFRYGSKEVNIVADATSRGGMGTFGYDDEGTRAKQAFLVKQGLFVGYQTSRETAGEVESPESSGGMRADSPLVIPLIRMTNINLLAGEWKRDEVIEDTKSGILVDTNRSWSIDDKRLNFQFGTEVGWIVKNGSLEQMVKGATYTGLTPQFWRSCDAVSRDDWMMWGTPNCGKGVPAQIMYVGHGCGTARFRKTRVGVLQ